MKPRPCWPPGMLAAILDGSLARWQAELRNERRVELAWAAFWVLAPLAAMALVLGSALL